MPKKITIRLILEEFIKEEIGKDLKIKPNIKPTHGNCCTCQVCGYNHDDCNCRIREAVKWINQTLLDIQALRIRKLPKEDDEIFKKSWNAYRTQAIERIKKEGV